MVTLIDPLNNPIYQELGVEPVIHAAGTKTTHGGTKSSPEVFAAMEMAAQSFVSLEELNRKVGAYIAHITGAEAGMVVAGAASGVVLSIAACMTGTDISKVRQLPNAIGMKNEMVVQKIHVGKYAHMYSFTGAKIIEVGNINGCLTAELAAAINERTAAVNFLFGPRISRAGLDLKKVVEVAHHYQVPVIVDAAAVLPPKENLTQYIKEGADLVTISGGKIIHGPQGTGLLFGRADLIDAAFANASPNHAIGRPHKLSREEIVGLYTALKIYLASNENSLFSEYRNRLSIIFETLKPFLAIDVNIKHDDYNYNVPVLTISFHPTWKGPDPEQLPALLLKEKPRIFMQYFKELGELVVNPVSLQPGQPVMVANKLANLFALYSEQIATHGLGS